MRAKLNIRTECDFKMKVVINRCFGGFSLSTEGIKRYRELSGELDADDYQIGRELKRDDKYLVQTVEELGDLSSGRCSVLEVVEIPDDVKWEISEYDGAETIHECHRSWPS